MKSFEQIAKAMYEAYRLYIQTSIGVSVPSWDSPLFMKRRRGSQQPRLHTKKYSATHKWTTQNQRHTI